MKRAFALCQRGILLLALLGCSLGGYEAPALAGSSGEEPASTEPAPARSSEPARPENAQADENDKGKKTEQQTGELPSLPRAESPTSVELPAAWFEPVLPRSRKLEFEDTAPFYQILGHLRGVPEKDLNQAAGKTLDAAIEDYKSQAEAELREKIIKAEGLKTSDSAAAAKMEEQAKKVFQAKMQQHEKYKKNPESYPMFVKLFRSVESSQPKQMQGKPVTLRGHIHKLISYEADTNDAGITRLYEAWLFTEGSQRNPLVVICTEVPEGIPMGEKIMADIEVTGYFFKVFGYEAKDSARIAPMVLAKGIKWIQPRPASPVPTWLYGAVGSALILLIFAAWYASQSDRRLSKLRAAEREKAPPPDLHNVQADELPGFAVEATSNLASSPPPAEKTPPATP